MAPGAKRLSKDLLGGRFRVAKVKGGNYARPSRKSRKEHKYEGNFVREEKTG